MWGEVGGPAVTLIVAEAAENNLSLYTDGDIIGCFETIETGIFSCCAVVRLDSLYACGRNTAAAAAAAATCTMFVRLLPRYSIVECFSGHGGGSGGHD